MYIFLIVTVKYTLIAENCSVSALDLIKNCYHQHFPHFSQCIRCCVPWPMPNAKNLRKATLSSRPENSATRRVDIENNIGYNRTYYIQHGADVYVHST